MRYPSLRTRSLTVHIDTDTSALTIDLTGTRRISASGLRAERTRAYVFAHGAGAGMTQSHDAIANGLAERASQHSATISFTWSAARSGRTHRARPQRGSRRCGKGRSVSLGTCRSSPAAILRRPHDLAGAALSRSQNVRGLVFFAFRFIPPASERRTRQALGRCPDTYAFLQGANDALASLDLLKPVVARLGYNATLALFERRRPSFHFRPKAGARIEVLAEMLETAPAGGRPLSDCFA